MTPRRVSSTSMRIPIPLATIALLSVTPFLRAELSDSSQISIEGGKKLRPQYTAEQRFAIPNSHVSVTMDLAGYEGANDGRNPGARLLTAGNMKRRMLVKVDTDTLFQDVERTASAYRDLWRYFHDSDTLSVMCCRRFWEDSLGAWEARTLASAHGMEINQKEYHLFAVRGDRHFHASIVRPLCLPEDTTVMLATLSSFRVTTDSSRATQLPAGVTHPPAGVTHPPAGMPHPTAGGVQDTGVKK